MTILIKCERLYNCHHCLMESQKFASNACAACKARKRRCDKKLPQCLLCSRNHRECNYSLPKHTIRGDIITVSQASNQYSTFPPMYFIDQQLFQSQGGFVPIQIQQLPAYVLSEIGPYLSISSRYFKTIHCWMPMLSKERFYHALGESEESWPLELALLILCMKLIISHPTEQHAQTSLYRAAKQFYLEVEMVGVFSLRMLQAAILIALYEVGHAIYPMAFTSVGVCARYGDALQLRPQTTLKSDTSPTGVEEEERRRLWWAIYILNQYSNLTYQSRPAAMDEPTADHPLPSDDRQWDQGLTKGTDYSCLVTPSHLQHSRFSLIAQAAALLGKVLRYVHQNDEGAVQEPEVSQLSRTIRALMEFARQECDGKAFFRVFGCEVKALTSSALLKLFNSPIRRDGALTISRSIAEELSCLDWEAAINATQRDRDGWAPFAIQTIHLAATILVDGLAERNTQQFTTILEPFKLALRAAKQRWKSAEVYLQALEAREAALSQGNMEESRGN